MAAIESTPHREGRCPMKCLSKMLQWAGTSSQDIGCGAIPRHVNFAVVTSFSALRCEAPPRVTQKRTLAEQQERLNTLLRTAGAPQELLALVHHENEGAEAGILALISACNSRRIAPWAQLASPYSSRTDSLTPIQFSIFVPCGLRHFRGLCSRYSRLRPLTPSLTPPPTRTPGNCPG